MKTFRKDWLETLPDLTASPPPITVPDFSEKVDLSFREALPSRSLLLSLGAEQEASRPGKE